MITLGALNDITGIRHCFCTRAGGVSTGLFTSLNCGFGSGDDPAAVRENRSRAMARFDLPGDRLVTLRQVHSARVVVVEEPMDPDQAPEADAIVTTRPGLAIGILHADCAPVLIADTKAKVVAAAHAGWQGALAGVLEATVDQMIAVGAKLSRLVAVIGPCIAQRSYEVGPEFRVRFVTDNPTNADFFAPSRRADHFMFDLPGYVARRVGNCGVPLIQCCPNNTAAEETRFFSYRRSVLRGEPAYGRNLSAISITE